VAVVEHPPDEFVDRGAVPDELEDLSQHRLAYPRAGDDVRPEVAEYPRGDAGDCAGRDREVSPAETGGHGL